MIVLLLIGFVICIRECYALYSICMALFGFYTDDPYGFASDIIRFLGDGGLFLWYLYWSRNIKSCCFDLFN